MALEGLQEELEFLTGRYAMRRRPVHGHLFSKPTSSRSHRPTLDDISIAGTKMTLPKQKSFPAFWPDGLPHTSPPLSSTSARSSSDAEQQVSAHHFMNFVSSPPRVRHLIASKEGLDRRHEDDDVAYLGRSHRAYTSPLLHPQDASHSRSLHLQLPRTVSGSPRPLLAAQLREAPAMVWEEEEELEEYEEAQAQEVCVREMVISVQQPAAARDSVGEAVVVRTQRQSDDAPDEEGDAASSPPTSPEEDVSEDKALCLAPETRTTGTGADMLLVLVHPCYAPRDMVVPSSPHPDLHLDLRAKSGSQTYYTHLAPPLHQEDLQDDKREATKMPALPISPSCLPPLAQAEATVQKQSKTKLKTGAKAKSKSTVQPINQGDKPATKPTKAQASPDKAAKQPVALKPLARSTNHLPVKTTKPLKQVISPKAKAADRRGKKAVAKTTSKTMVMGKLKEHRPASEEPVDKPKPLPISLPEDMETGTDTQVSPEPPKSRSPTRKKEKVIAPPPQQLTALPDTVAPPKVVEVELTKRSSWIFGENDDDDKEERDGENLHENPEDPPVKVDLPDLPSTLPVTSQRGARATLAAGAPCSVCP
ncbi:actin cytoskeleton-regulatory complex protein PAN1-like isoform X3 [Pomacea canaliculata]|uniref:actin cytoskeleton-regulatory complex protein PAN1-like isoform X3 n=1 Tax=Pomacea canaliculata TaxID=400727 RepID=UPI000D738D5B|nr:actin cytoskeleton-regulatory complex protein PAN1-like isoform X3 [Pomacea canaliculata]